MGPSPQVALLLTLASTIDSSNCLLGLLIPQKIATCLTTNRHLGSFNSLDLQKLEEQLPN